MSSKQSTITTPTNQATGGPDLLAAALDLNAGGLRVIPVWTADKVPFPKWEQYRQGQTADDVRAVFSSRQTAPDRIALILTGGMEAIDIDTKADPARTIDREFFDKVKATAGDAEILKKCLLQKTKSGGWHLLYRAENADPKNIQLAKRAKPVIKDGRETFPAVIETRGTEKGLLYVAPSPGYEVRQGDFLNLPTLTPDERNILITAARELDERADIAPPAEKSHTAQNTRPQSDQATSAAGALSPWDDFNQRADLLGLLEGGGWHVVNQQADGRARLSKPGASNGRDVHGSIIKTRAGELRFYPFTTATSFEPEKCYSPAAVFGVMECNGDWSKTTAALRAKGYGAPLTNQLPTQKSKQGSAANPGRNAGPILAETTPPPANLATFAAITADRVTIVQDDTAARAALDAGLQNVVDAGPDGLQPAHIRAALDAGAKYFTVCFSDPAATFATVETLLRYHETEQENYFVFVAELPAGFFSLGDFARENGSDAAAELLKDADGAAVYLAKWFGQVRAQEIANERTSGSLDKDLLRPYFKAEISRLFRLLPVSESAYFQHVLNDVAENYFLTWDEIKHDAETLREREAERRYQERAAKLAAQAGQAFADGDAEKGEAILSKVKEERSKAGANKFAGLLEAATFDQVRQVLVNQPATLETRFYFWENEEGRSGRKHPLKLPAGALSFFAARPGVGKTRMLLNLALHVCEAEPDKEVYFLTYEESAEALTLKGLTAYTDTDFAERGATNLDAAEVYFRGDNGLIQPGQLATFEAKTRQYFSALIEAKRLNFIYSDFGGQGLADAIQYLKKRRKVAAVFIDYIQLINMEKTRAADNRQQEVKAICNALKDAARETGLPVIFGAQINRDGADTPPKLHHIREAGDIEQTAALVVGLHLQKDPATGADELRAEILKQRGGIKDVVGFWPVNGERWKVYPDTLHQGQGAQPGQKFNPNQNPFTSI
jgi:replicative DNA helicase